MSDQVREEDTHHRYLKVAITSKSKQTLINQADEGMRQPWKLTNQRGIMFTIKISTFKSVSLPWDTLEHGA